MGKLRRQMLDKVWALTAVKAFCAGLLSLETHHPATHCSAGLSLKCARYGTVKMVPLLSGGQYFPGL